MTWRKGQEAEHGAPLWAPAHQQSAHRRETKAEDAWGPPAAQCEGELPHGGRPGGQGVRLWLTQHPGRRGWTPVVS